MTRSDLDQARSLFNSLDSMTPGSVRASVIALLQALEQGRWYGVRFLLLWIGLESLFGSASAQETTFRLTQRAALFLSESPIEAKATADALRKNYTYRSKVVHGRSANASDEAALDRLDFAEQKLRGALRKILRDAGIVSVFNGTGREQYLDDLAYRGVTP